MFLGRRRQTKVPIGKALAFSCLGFTACTRPAVASLLPLLELGLSAHRLRSESSGSEREGADQRWHATAFIALRFKPRTVAAQIPLRADLAPETWLLPCDSDDVICLQEALEAETELARTMGELQ